MWNFSCRGLTSINRGTYHIRSLTWSLVRARLWNVFFLHCSRVAILPFSFFEWFLRILRSLSGGKQYHSKHFHTALWKIALKRPNRTRALIMHGFSFTKSILRTARIVFKSDSECRLILFWFPGRIMTSAVMMFQLFFEVLTRACLSISIYASSQTTSVQKKLRRLNLGKHVMQSDL